MSTPRVQTNWNAIVYIRNAHQYTPRQPTQKINIRHSNCRESSWQGLWRLRHSQRKAFNERSPEVVSSVKGDAMDAVTSVTGDAIYESQGEIHEFDIV